MGRIHQNMSSQEINESSASIAQSAESVNIFNPHNNFPIIVQDPYPPLNCSPEFCDDPMSNLIDCFQIDELSILASENHMNIKNEITHDNF